MTAPIPELRRLLADPGVEHLVNAYGYTLADLAAVLDAAEAMAAELDSQAPLYGNGNIYSPALARWRELTGETTNG